MAAQPRSSPFTHTGQITTKVPPSFNGTDDWFRYEESVEEWLDLTELGVDKRGPTLKTRLEGPTTLYGDVLDRDELKKETGVAYFLNALRPFFVKGKPAISCGDS